MLSASRNCSLCLSKLKPLVSLSSFSLSKSIPPPSPSSDSIPRPHRPHNPQSIFFSTSSSRPDPPKRSSLPLTRDGNYDDATPRAAVCPGCGVHLQDSDSKHPGFFIAPSEKDPNYRLRTHLRIVTDESEISDSVKRGFVIEHGDPIAAVRSGSGRPVVCARCHSLRNYGKVKDPTVENLLPDFDFDHTVGRRLVATDGRRSVVLMVVDAADFDGSFPKKVAKLVSDAIDENFAVWKEGKSGNVPRIVLVVTKIDLLPSSISPTSFEHWVRHRAREGGASKITSLHLVSPVKDWGLKNLVDDVVHLAGPRGNVWAVGAQNAGKSTLINAIGKCVKGEVSHLTEAPVPGTTLGIIRVEGALPGQAKLFDTPGLLNPNQITTRLTREEQKLVQISKELRPRTYRIKEGHSIHIAGLMRLDIDKSSAESIYVTVWASPYLPLHMGKTENVQNMLEEHFGHQLQPPIGEERVKELGNWVRQEFRVSGNTWDSSSTDIAAAGLGWFAIGLKGEAEVSAWTYEGVDLVARRSVIPFRSRNFEVAGFTVSKIVSRADQAMNKSGKQGGKQKKNKKKGSEQSENSTSCAV